MEPHLAFATRDELWHLQNDMKSVYSTQADHGDRLARLERKLDEDTRVKSVWGSSSPFPSALGGTPQHDPGYNPAAEAFKAFDQEPSNNLLGSLHIDTDDEPRRGASRANSVRFDESALQGQGGHFGHTSRSSSEFFPPRTVGGLGGVSMLERSSSHKSDGRQSSTHSTRLNSLALDSRSPALEGLSNMGPPPGLLFLGPHPSIIRCWLDSNFVNDALLYAAVCTGSYTSMISSQILERLTLPVQQARSNKVTLTVYFAEGTIPQASNRPLDLIQQVPSISAEFEIYDTADGDDSIQVIIGSDILRAKNADISFSQERITLIDDEHHKLAVPLVRPENQSIFQKLRTSSSKSSHNGVSLSASREAENDVAERFLIRPKHTQNSVNSDNASAPALKLNTTLDEPILETPVLNRLSVDDQRETNGVRSSTPSKEKEAAIWGNWRRDSNQPSVTETTFSSVITNGNTNTSIRGKGMKVLRPSRSGQSRSISSSQTLTNIEPAASRWPEQQPNRGAPSVTSDNGSSRLTSPRRSFSSETRSSIPAAKPRSANPIGGGSAFGWLNPGQK